MALVQMRWSVHYDIYDRMLNMCICVDVCIYGRMACCWCACAVGVALCDVD